MVLRTRLDPAGRITSATAQFSFFVRSCPEGTQLTQAHVHQGPAGRNGEISIDAGLGRGGAVAMKGGEIGLNIEDVAVTDVSLLTDMIANPARYYMNVHSAMHPVGLLRGQLVHEP